MESIDFFIRKSSYMNFIYRNQANIHFLFYLYPAEPVRLGPPGRLRGFHSCCYAETMFLHQAIKFYIFISKREFRYTTMFCYAEIKLIACLPGNQVNILYFERRCSRKAILGTHRAFLYGK